MSLCIILLFDHCFNFAEDIVHDGFICLHLVEEDGGVEKFFNCVALRDALEHVDYITLINQKHCWYAPNIQPRRQLWQVINIKFDHFDLSFQIFNFFF